ncbi:MAG: peptidase S41, partial [bacterium]|nr:peptidase S41 [bacterium]
MLDRRTLSVLLCLCAVTLLAVHPVAGQTKLLRFPDIHGDRVAFTYAGDIWLAPVSGGTATQLTTHPGLELFAKFSPDGRWIAFTGQYDGDEQVYVVSTEGGVPRQLTYYPAAGPLPPRWGYDYQVYGWTPDGNAVLFRSMRDGWDLSDTNLFTVALDGGLPVALPMPESGGGALSPDGKKVVYSPVTRDFRHWKRYEGGWAQDLHILDLESLTTERITDHPRSDRDPMWIGEKIYFSSDRDGKLNLYAFDTSTRETEQLTHSELWDLRWPSSDETGRIVYELSGELQVFDAATRASQPIPIRVPSDGLAMRPARIPAGNRIEGYGLSPEGKRAVFAARGDIFTAPIEHGPTRNLTRSSGAHDRQPAWSPDGKQIAFVSDRDGEEEIYLIDQDGHGEPEQLTDGSIGRYYDLAWSPTGKHIALRNQKSKLFVLAVESRELVEVADDGEPFDLDFNWSPNGGYLAFSLVDANGFRSLYIRSLKDRRTHRITEEIFNEYSPSWDPGGDYLFYLSDREFAPQLGSFEFDYLVDRETYVYALALRKDVAHPFPPRSDEVTIDGEDDGEKAASAEGEKKENAKKGKKGKKAEKGDEEAEEEAQKPITIDFDGLAQRVVRVPVAADNYFAVEALDGRLMIARGFAEYYGRESDRTAEISIFSLADREETTLASGIRGAAVSPDRSKLLLRLNGGYQLYDASPGGKDSSKTVSTAGLRVDRVPAEEWAQIFDEVWRRYRDFFYVENMHGYDWEALREQYRPLIEHVGHRSDLNYLISEMIAELNVSHTYITGGDWETPARPAAALLGCRFALDAESGRYRISEVFPGHNQEDIYRSPLTEVGVDVSAGDYLLEINGEELTGADNPYRLLRQAGRSTVELTVASQPTLEGSRRIVVRPIRDEDNLIYLGWIEGNRRRVAERSDGRVGYIHIPDMGGNGIREWIK